MPHCTIPKIYSYIQRDLVLEIVGQMVIFHLFIFSIFFFSELIPNEGYYQSDETYNSIFDMIDREADNSDSFEVNFFIFILFHPNTNPLALKGLHFSSFSFGRHWERTGIQYFGKLVRTVPKKTHSNLLCISFPRK